MSLPEENFYSQGPVGLQSFEIAGQNLYKGDHRALFEANA